MPADPDNYVNRGVVLLRRDREDEARVEFIHALELDSHKTSAAVNLIGIELRRGKIEQANSYLRRETVASSANSRRIANAITSRLPNESFSRDALQRFALRACQLSGGQRDLIVAAAAIKSSRR